MIENHMVLPTATPKQYDQDAPEPERTEMCLICKKQGQLRDGLWYLDGDADDELTGAEDIPLGWTCSERCRLQAMYQNATPKEQDALDRVLDACRTLQEYGQMASSFVNKNTDGFVGSGLYGEAKEFVDIIEGGKARPEWAERDRYEEALEFAIFQASRKMRTVMDDDRRIARSRMNQDKISFSEEWQARDHAARAWTMAEALLLLKEADRSQR